MEYLGCYSGSDINSVDSLFKMGGSKVRASTCQYMCYSKSVAYDMFFLNDGHCFCGESQQNQLPSSPLDPSASCSTSCPSLPADNAYEALGCYFDQSGDRDLPVAGTTIGTVDAASCSAACDGYAFLPFKVQIVFVVIRTANMVVLLVPIVPTRQTTLTPCTNKRLR
jgi:hypothetical protein